MRIHADRFTRDLVFILEDDCEGYTDIEDRLKIVIDSYLGFEQMQPWFRSDWHVTEPNIINRGRIDCTDGSTFEWYNSTGQFEELVACGLDDEAWSTATNPLRYLT